ncbi:MAG: rRNA maturation RNase YbeY [Bacteroidales bacterium]|nr:rRNA maturation RNase YbeY [Bacteroidales bacterium]
MELNINFYNEDSNFTIKDKNTLKGNFEKIFSKEKPLSGNVNFIFCSDKYLINLNTRFLKHKSLTDIITFENYYGKNNLIADIYISIDRIKENSKKYKVIFEKELYRVMIHGILHIAGYKDKTPADKATMTKKENIYLKMFHVKRK